MEQATVVSIDRWSLYRGTLVSLRWPKEQTTVVSIDRWSLRQVRFTVLQNRANILQYSVCTF